MWSDRMYAALVVPRDALIVRRWKWQSGRYDDVAWWAHDADCLSRYERALWYLVKRGLRKRAAREDESGDSDGG